MCDLPIEVFVFSGRDSWKPACYLLTRSRSPFLVTQDCLAEIDDRDRDVKGKIDSVQTACAPARAELRALDFELKLTRVAPSLPINGMLTSFHGAVHGAARMFVASSASGEADITLPCSCTRIMICS